MNDRPAISDFLTIQRDDHRAVVMHAGAAGDAAVVCAACPGRAGPNEDAVGVFALSGNAVVLAVADGMGGGPSGARAAEAAIAALARALGPHRAGGTVDPDGLRGEVVNALEAASGTILGWGVGAGATVVVAVVTPGGFRTLHAGDSAALVTGQRGVLKHLTTAHSPVGFAQAAGLLDAEAAMNHDERHVVSNFLGSDTLNIEMSSPRPLAARDTLVLASDGLFDNLSVAEVVAAARCGPLHTTTASLLARAHRQMAGDGKPDDLGLIVFRPARPTPRV